MMRRAAAFLLLTATTLALGVAAPPPPDEPMPHVVFAFDPRHPVFLEASRVIDENGRVRRDAPLTEMAERNLTDLFKLPRDSGCARVEEVYLDYVNAPRRMGLTGAIATADFIIETKVQGRSFGFMKGIPGQLLRLGDIKLLKAAPPDASWYYYIFVPVADFTVGGLHICKIDRGYGDAPQFGDTVFVFGDKAWFANGFIDVVDPTGYARALPDGRVLLPKRLRGNDDTPVTADDIRRAARHAGRRPDAP